MSDAAVEERPEADRADGAPHPRFASSLVGLDAAEAAFLDALNQNRLHHAWLITGPPGIGKATLAWRLARFLLVNRPGRSAGLFNEAAQTFETLDVDPQAPAAQRMRAMSDPGLSVLRRPWDDRSKKLKTVITVDEVRLLKRRFTLSLPDGGRRVVIVDSADDMNTSAANALLKLLEEPPADTVFLLVSHMPSRLLPTIRSRCRTLPCHPLSAAQVAHVLGGLDAEMTAGTADALAALARGSVGRAVKLHQFDGTALQAEIEQLFMTMPGVDRGRLLSLAASLAARGAEDRRDLFLELVDGMLSDLARVGVRGDPDGAFARLSPDIASGRRWAEAQQEMTARVRQGLAVNLDPHSLILDMILRIDATAVRCATS